MLKFSTWKLGKCFMVKVLPMVDVTSGKMSVGGSASPWSCSCSRRSNSLEQELSTNLRRSSKENKNDQRSWKYNSCPPFASVRGSTLCPKIHCKFAVWRSQAFFKQLRHAASRLRLVPTWLQKWFIFNMIWTLKSKNINLNAEIYKTLHFSNGIYMKTCFLL